MYTMKQRKEPPSPKTAWLYKSSDWEELPDYLSVFPRGVTCFPNKNATEAFDDITEIIQCAMESYIPHTYKLS